ncbi:MAG: HAD family hydrolase [Actinobacteria bacterium]|nr:MAG: HAD family hydrolase [Actinomycetota bacterium]
MAGGERWASFDCYGTLIDWNGGIGRELERLFGAARAGELLHAYHELEPQIQREDPSRSYREVLAIALARLGAPASEQDALGQSLPGWDAFAEVPQALEEARARGWRLAVLSNTDRDLLEASLARIGVEFELSIVASEISSYKPSRGHWNEFFAQSGADRERHVHVGASLFHDIAPAAALGLRTIWINRLGEEAEPQPDLELHSLTGLAETLDSLVP